MLHHCSKLGRRFREGSTTFCLGEEGKRVKLKLGEQKAEIREKILPRRREEEAIFGGREDEAKRGGGEIAEKDAEGDLEIMER